MIKVKCKKCGNIGYSAFHKIKCDCGGYCRILPTETKAAKKEQKDK